MSSAQLLLNVAVQLQDSQLLRKEEPLSLVRSSCGLTAGLQRQRLQPPPRTRRCRAAGSLVGQTGRTLLRSGVNRCAQHRVAKVHLHLGVLKLKSHRHEIPQEPALLLWSSLSRPLPCTRQ